MAHNDPPVNDKITAVMSRGTSLRTEVHRCGPIVGFFGKFKYLERESLGLLRTVCSSSRRRLMSRGKLGHADAQLLAVMLFLVLNHQL